MKYMLLIQQGTTPVPGTPEWEALSDAERNAIPADYRAINETPGVTPGVWMEAAETATTVRVQDGKTLTTDGPFAETRETLGGYYLVDAKNLDEATAIAARIPGARYGCVEVRPIWALGEP